MPHRHAGFFTICTAALLCLLCTASGGPIRRNRVAADVPAARRAARAARQPADAREGRARRQAVCRPAPVRHRQALLRQLPPARARLHRRPPAARALRARRCGATRPRFGTSPGASSSSGTAARLRWRRRCAVPIEAADEMGGDWPAILRRLEADAGLVAAVPERLSRRARHLARRRSSRRLASYVRSLVSPPTRFDAWIDGDASALERRRGARLPPVHRQGRLRAVPRRLALHRRPLPRHRPARQGSRPRRRARRHAGAHGLQDAGPARAGAHRALHARRLAADAGGRARALHRRLRRAAHAGAAHEPPSAPDARRRRRT